MRLISLGWMALSTYLQANSNSKSFVSLLPLAHRATALSSPRRLDTNDL
jgi:hypothetical protein